MEYKCYYCEKTFSTVQARNSHTGKCKCNPSYVKKPKSQAWYESMKHQKEREYKGGYVCKFCGRQNLKCLGNHERSCKLNPNRIPGWSFNIKRTEEEKKKVSESMKKAHAEGRAWEWQSRSKLSHSYPELWVIGLLEKELNLKENIDYITEMPFFGQFLDFAWADRKLCIEIDGKQHQEEYRKSLDERKNKNLKDNGWKLLRLEWSWIMENKVSAKNKILNFLKYKS